MHIMIDWGKLAILSLYMLIKLNFKPNKSRRPNNAHANNKDIFDWLLAFSFSLPMFNDDNSIEGVSIATWTCEET